MARKKVFAGLVTVAFLFFSGLFLWQLSRSELRLGADLAELDREFAQVSAPANAAPTGDLNRISKLSLLVVARTYFTELPPSAVRSHYAGQLMAQGWRAADAPSPAIVRYCKGQLDAVLEVQEDGSGTRYYFGIRWQQGARVSTGCV